MRYIVKTAGDQVVLENGTALTLTQCSQLMRLPYAQTYASCQGDDFFEVKRFDVDHRHFTWRHLYVGMSRSKGRLEIA